MPVSDHEISQLHAFFLAATISSSYVLSVYLSLLLAKPKVPLWRNDPAVIKARSFLATAGTLACCGIVYVAMRNVVNESSSAMPATLEHLGVPVHLSSAFSSIGRANFIVPVLFLGPLYATYLTRSLPLQENWDLNKDLIHRFSTWEGFRNYIMAPVTEEMTYRACLLSIYKLAGYSKKTMIWVAPCWFGLAHVHHAFETYKRLGKRPAALRTAVINTLFQFAYTTIFGWLCSFLFLRTGSIIVPISAHIFCNVMGFPTITWELRQFPSHKASIIIAYLSGVVLFFYSLFPWSFNPDSIYWTN